MYNIATYMYIPHHIMQYVLYIPHGVHVHAHAAHQGGCAATADVGQVVDGVLCQPTVF